MAEFRFFEGGSDRAHRLKRCKPGAVNRQPSCKAVAERGDIGGSGLMIVDWRLKIDRSETFGLQKPAPVAKRAVHPQMAARTTGRPAAWIASARSNGQESWKHYGSEAVWLVALPSDSEALRLELPSGVALIDRLERLRLGSLVGSTFSEHGLNNRKEQHSKRPETVAVGLVVEFEASHLAQRVFERSALSLECNGKTGRGAPASKARSVGPRKP
jgi:hypothetical protein